MAHRRQLARMHVGHRLGNWLWHADCFIIDLVAAVCVSCCQQADPNKLGSVDLSGGSGVSKWWGAAGRLGGGSRVPLDSGNIHHFLTTADNEDARKQVSGLL